jgi:hypothetical protein
MAPAASSTHATASERSNLYHVALGAYRPFDKLRNEQVERETIL